MYLGSNKEFVAAKGRLPINRIEAAFACLVAHLANEGDRQIRVAREGGARCVEADLSGCTTLSDVAAKLREAPDGPCDGTARFCVGRGRDYVTADLALLHIGKRWALASPSQAIGPDLLRVLCNFTRRLLKAKDTTPLSRITLLGDVATREALARFNRTARPRTLLDPVEQLSRLALQTPNAVAAIEKDVQVNFSDLAFNVQSLSAALQAQTEPGDAVGVCLPRGIDSVTALLAVWHAGLVWLPLPPSVPEAHKAAMLETAGAELVLCRKATAIEGPALLYLEDVQDRCASPRERDPESCAAVMFTSGTTGVPNGVRHSKRALANRFNWWLEAYPAAEDDVYMHRTAMNFIPSLTEMVSGVLSGRPLVVLDDTDAANPEAIAAAIEAHRVTRVAVLPTLLRKILDLKTTRAEALRSLRVVTSAGEPCDLSLVSRLEELVPGCEVLNDYGCTETNGVLVASSADVPVGAERLPAGRPIPNCMALVLTHGGQLAPVGLEGELCIAGLGVGRGYIGREALNETRFIALDVPKDAVPGGKLRLFRTRDRARVLPCGQIEVLGRLDNLLKIRGIRIEVEGTETELQQLPGIAEAACGPVKSTSGATHLGAWVVWRSADVAMSDAELRARLSEKLPEAAVPTRIFTVEALPRTPNGKLARARLAEAVPVELDVPVAQAAPEPASKDVLPVVMAALARVLDTSPAALHPQQDFKLLGLDSISVVDFVQDLSRVLGRDVSVDAPFNSATPRRLADYLGQSTAKAATPRRRAKAQTGDVAVVGMACRMPQAPDLSSFWALLKEGRSAVTEIPARRWNWRQFSKDAAPKQGHSISRWGAFIEGEDLFDPMFFNISAREAQVMSPEQRLFIEACWHALDDAGLPATSLAGQRVGVFAGVRPSDYAEHLREAGHLPDAQSLLGLDSAILAGRVAYALDLRGPALTIDTACSSSLVAIHQAARALLEGDAELALAGGVSLVTSPTQYVQNTRAGMLSPDGRCATFSDGANGFVQGEGCGVVVLKPLAEAEADGDRVYAVIKASGVNQDGRSNGITAPNGEAQRALLEQVHGDSGAPSAAIGLVEAHGTGTKLGDPIEFEALRHVFETSGAGPNACALGSVKTNIGHLIAAAGVAGFIKACLALHKRHIPPSLNFSNPNPHIDLENSPFRVPVEGATWDADQPRRAAVSAFGFSGTNCHVVLEEGPAGADPDETDTPALVLLSASTEDALALQAGVLAKALAAATEKPRLVDVALTLSRRLNTLPASAALWAEDIDGLIDGLQAVAAGQPHGGVLASGLRGEGISTAKLSKVAEGLTREAAADGLDADAALALSKLFVMGEALDLVPLYRDLGGVICDLPPAPFVRQRYWVGPAKTARSTSELQLPATLCDAHLVQGRPWAPAAGQLMAALLDRGFDAPTDVTDWALMSSVAARTGEGVAMALSTETGDCGGDRLIWRHSDRLCARATVASLPDPALGTVPPDTVREMLAGLGTIEQASDFYARCRDHGLGYGPLFQAVRRQHRGAARAISFLSCPDSAADDPLLRQSALLDAAMHTLVGLTPKGQSAVPVAVARLRLAGPLPPRMIVLSEIKKRESAELTAELRILTEEGQIVGIFDGLRLQVLSGSTAKTPPVATSDRCELGAWTRELTHVQTAATVPQLTDVQVLPQRPDELGPKWERGTDFFIWRSSATSIEMLIEDFVMYARHLTETTKTTRLIVETGGLAGGAAALAAAARAIRAERPSLHVKVLDTAAPKTPAAEDFAFEGVAVKTGSKWVPAMTKRAAPAASSPNPVCLVTGGLGGVGRKLVEWLVQTECANVALASHRPLDSDERLWIEDLRKSSGQEIAAYEANLACADDCDALLRKIALRFGALDRVYHCAGVTADALIANKTRAQIDRVMQAKMRSIETLDAAMANMPLDQMVLFSSVSAVVGTPGQADYAAANAWLDDFAARRNASTTRKGRTLSVNWALMADGRMSPPPAELKRLRRTHGMAPMPSDQGFAKMQELVATSDADQAVIAYGDPAKLGAWINADAPTHQAPETLQ